MAKILDHIQCVFITPKDFDRVVQFARDYFLNVTLLWLILFCWEFQLNYTLFQDEPLCNSMNLKVSPGHDYYVRYVIEQGNSVMAIDTSKNDKIVGLRGHRVNNRNESVAAYNSPEDEKWDRVYSLGSFAFNRVDPWNKYDIDSMLEAKFLAVHREYRGMNIGVMMIQFTLDFMRREKIPLFYLWATNEYTKNVVGKLGFEKVDEMNYTDYKVDGKQVFFPPEMHPSYAIYVKWV